MPRTLRLTSSRDFARVLRTGRRGSTPLVTCVALDSDPEQPARVGFAVGSSVGNAVKRNRARRLLREAVRAACIESGNDVIVVGRPAIAGRSFAEVRDALWIALERAGVLC